MKEVKKLRVRATNGYEPTTCFAYAYLWQVGDDTFAMRVRGVRMVLKKLGVGKDYRLQCFYKGSWCNVVEMP